MADNAGSREDSKSNVESADIREIFRFLREENEANRRASREDADATRKLLTDTAKVVSFPLTVLLAVAAFLGVKDFSTFKNELNTYAEQQKPQILAGVQEKVAAEVNTPEIENVIRADVEKSPVIQNVVNDEIQKKLVEVSKATAQVVDKAEANIDAQARASAPLVASLGSALDPSIQARPSTPIKLTVSERNFGQPDAYLIGVYGSIELRPIQTVDDRKKTLEQIAAQVEQKRIAAKSDFVVPQKLSWGQGFSGSFQTSKPISENEQQKLRDGELALYFVYLIEFRSSNQENTRLAWHAGEVTRNLKPVEGIPIDPPRNWPR